jgi:hypothetical protein
MSGRCGSAQASPSCCPSAWPHTAPPATIRIGLNRGDCELGEILKWMVGTSLVETVKFWIRFDGITEEESGRLWNLTLWYLVSEDMDLESWKLRNLRFVRSRNLYVRGMRKIVRG